MRAGRSLLTVCAIALAACGGGATAPATTTGGGGGGGGGGDNPGGGSTSNAISVVDNAFNPSGTTVAAGTTVTWTWNGQTDHNVTFDNASVGNSQTQTSGTFARTFTTPATYNYHCIIHGSAMSGVVTVQ